MIDPKIPWFLCYNYIFNFVTKTVGYFRSRATQAALRGLPCTPGRLTNFSMSPKPSKSFVATYIYESLLWSGKTLLNNPEQERLL